MRQSARSINRSAIRASARGKMLDSIDAAFDACAIADRHVLSFHHHMRNGDEIAAAVIDVAAARGLRDLGLAISSLFPAHAPLVPHIRSGVISRIWTNYAKGPVADAICDGAVGGSVRLQTHGGRARAIESGELKIDTAFIAAPLASHDGALTGASGRAACGPLGYAMVDAAHARHVVALVEEFTDEAMPRIEIDATSIDHIVPVTRIGDPAGILSGTTQVAADDISRMVANRAADAIAACGMIRDGMSFQTGAGGISLAAVEAVGTRMQAANVTGSFISGGICGAHVDLVRRGLFREIFDVQCFDLHAVQSYAHDSWHHAMSASDYASPLRTDAIVNRLDVMILGAAEIDRAFNINVTTGGDGRIIGGPGGHPDTAAGAKLRIATTRLTGGGYAKVVDKVRTITTVGSNVDILVTDAGISINPARADLHRMVEDAGLVTCDIGEQITLAAKSATRQPTGGGGKAVAHVEDRNGQILDTVFGRASSETSIAG